MTFLDLRVWFHRVIWNMHLRPWEKENDFFNFGFSLTTVVSFSQSTEVPKIGNMLQDSRKCFCSLIINVCGVVNVLRRNDVKGNYSFNISPLTPDTAKVLGGFFDSEKLTPTLPNCRIWPIRWLVKINNNNQILLLPNLHNFKHVFDKRQDEI